MRSLGEMIEIGVNHSIVFISYFSCRDVSTFSRYLTRGVSAWQKRRPEQHSSTVSGAAVIEMMECGLEPGKNV